jgi:hypothetical protein
MNSIQRNPKDSIQTKTTLSQKASISKQIEELHLSKNLNYLDAIMLWCEDNDMEIDEVAHIIKKDSELKAKLQKEGECNHLLKPSTITANTLLI